MIATTPSPRPASPSPATPSLGAPCQASPRPAPPSLASMAEDSRFAREEREAVARIDWVNEQIEAELDAAAERYGIDREDEQSLKEALEDERDWWSDRR